MSSPPTAESLDGKATRERVLLLIQVNRTRDAIHLAKEGLSSDPTDSELMALIASALLIEGKAPPALAWIDRSLSIDPEAAWVHNLRSKALLADGGSPAEAVAAARFAVQSHPEREDFLYTLAAACLHNKDRLGAEWAAQTLRRVAPASALGPLAEALVELYRGRAFFRENWVAWIAISAVVTQGSSVVIIGIWWIIRTIWRVPFLRRADDLLHEALQLDPASASVRVVAAEVLRMRFRLAQSVDYEVAAAALKAGLVDAASLARRITWRTAGLAMFFTPVWALGVALLDRPIAAESTVAVVGAALGVLFVMLVAVFDRWQTRSLPPLLMRNVRSRWPLPIVASVATVWVVGAGLTYPFDPDQPARGYHLAALVITPLLAACTTIVLTRFIKSRRTL